MTLTSERDDIAVLPFGGTPSPVATQTLSPASQLDSVTQQKPEQPKIQAPYEPSQGRSGVDVSPAPDGQVTRSAGRPVADLTPRAGHHRRRAVLVAAVVLGGGTLVAAFGRSTFTSGIASFAHINWIWVVVALGAEVASMGAFARVQLRLLRAGGAKLRFRSCLAITYAGNALSVSLPLAGPEMAVAFEFRQFGRRGIDSAVAAWTLAISGIISSTALGVVFLGGGLASGSVIAAVLGFVAAIVMLVPTIAVLAALHYPAARRLMNRLLDRLIAAARRCTKRPARGAEESLERFLDRLVTLRLSRLQYVEVFGLSLWNWIADCLCLAAAIRATGSSVPWQGLLLAYGGAMTASSIGLTPGGLGIIEAALTAALVAAGLTSHHALAGVLVYRLISFWLIMAAGWAIMALLTRNSRSRQFDLAASNIEADSCQTSRAFDLC